MLFTTTIHTFTTVISILGFRVVHLLFRIPAKIVDKVSKKNHFKVL